MLKLAIVIIVFALIVGSYTYIVFTQDKWKIKNIKKFNIIIDIIWSILMTITVYGCFCYWI